MVYLCLPLLCHGAGRPSPRTILADRISVPSLVLALLLTGGLAACGDRGPGGQDYSSADLDAAERELRELYRLRDWDRGSRVGAAWAARAPEAVRLRAWYAHNLARNREVDAAVKHGEALVAEYPDDPWSHWGLAGALTRHRERGAEALEVSLIPLEADPANPDFVQLRIDVLRAHENNEAALEYFAGLSDELRAHPDIIVRKGVAQYYAASARDAPPDAPSLDDALATFEEARRLDPDHVEAHFLPGAYLVGSRRAEEGLALLERAIELSPASADVHQYYWSAVMGRRDIPADEKRATVLEAIGLLLAQDPDAPAALSAAAYQYGELDLRDEQRAAEDRILEVAPESSLAEWVHVNRYRATSEELRELADERKKAEAANDERRLAELDAKKAELETRYEEQLEAFLARDATIDPDLIGDAYRSLFYLVREREDLPPERLLEISRGLAEHEHMNVHISFAQAPIALAEKTGFYDEAATIVRSGFERAWKRISESKQFGAYDGPGEWDQVQRYMWSMLYDALGWVYFNQGRDEDAEHLLLKSHEIMKDGRDNLYHLGRLYEAWYRDAASATQEAELADPAVADRHYELAEEFYIKGAGTQGMGENPSDEALRALYESRYGSLAGFEDYLADVDERDRQRRMRKIREEKLETPEAHTRFHLVDLDGKEWTSEDLVGRMAVINFWGVWCGPCVAEMPDIQDLHERYRDDPAVLVLTINNDINVDDAREYMAANGFDFLVLIDDGYLRDAMVHAFPTTWFMDGEGLIHFRKQGWSEALVEEFGWRIDILREDRVG